MPNSADCNPLLIVTGALKYYQNIFATSSKLAKKFAFLNNAIQRSPGHRKPNKFSNNNIFVNDHAADGLQTELNLIRCSVLVFVVVELELERRFKYAIIYAKNSLTTFFVNLF